MECGPPSPRSHLARFDQLSAHRCRSYRLAPCSSCDAYAASSQTTSCATPLRRRRRLYGQSTLLPSSLGCCICSSSYSELCTLRSLLRRGDGLARLRLRSSSPLSPSTITSTCGDSLQACPLVRRPADTLRTLPSAVALSACDLPPALQPPMPVLALATRWGASLDSRLAAHSATARRALYESERRRLHSAPSSPPLSSSCSKQYAHAPFQPAESYSYADLNRLAKASRSTTMSMLSCGSLDMLALVPLVVAGNEAAAAAEKELHARSGQATMKRAQQLAAAARERARLRECEVAALEMARTLAADLPTRRGACGTFAGNLADTPTLNHASSSAPPRAHSAPLATDDAENMLVSGIKALESQLQGRDQVDLPGALPRRRDAMLVGQEPRRPFALSGGAVSTINADLAAMWLGGPRYS